MPDKTSVEIYRISGASLRINNIVSFDDDVLNGVIHIHAVEKKLQPNHTTFGQDFQPAAYDLHYKIYHKNILGYRHRKAVTKETEEEIT